MPEARAAGGTFAAEGGIRSREKVNQRGGSELCVPLGARGATGGGRGRQLREGVGPERYFVLIMVFCTPCQRGMLRGA